LKAEDQMSTRATPLPATHRSADPATSRELTAAELERAGLLHVDPTATLSRFAVFVPADELGTRWPVVIHAGAVIGPFAVIHGGTMIGEQARVEEHAVAGKPELGYAVGRIRPGSGGGTVIGAGAVIRSGAVLYAEVRVGVNTVVGHHTLLRTAVQVGAETQLGHHLTVERATRIGRDVRCSPGSHLTSSCELADRVFLGAGVRTINDKTLTWRESNREPTLTPPRFDTGAKVGSGSVVLAGVTIGEHALVGAGSLVACDVPPGALAYGHPARVRGDAP
jgi:acetyltransferase-like isoleucine patch superfamily enzyme